MILYQSSKRGGLIQSIKPNGIRVIYIYTMALLAYGLCGSKDGEITFILNTGFFWVKDNNMHGSLSVIGQKYSFYHIPNWLHIWVETVNNLTNQVAWLRVQYTFELIPEVKL